MSAARGVALGARSALVAVVAVRRAAAAATAARVQARVPERRPARQGRRRADRRPAVGTVKKIELTDDNLARGHGRGRGALRAAARGHHRDHPRDLAVGRRQPLRRADAGADSAARARRRRRVIGTTRRRRSSTSTSSSTRSTRRRARPAAGHPGLRRPVRGQGAQANESREVLRAGAVDATRELVNEAHRRPAGAQRPRRRTPRRSSPRSPRAAATLTDLVSNTNTTLGAIAAENALARRRRSSSCPATLRRGNTTFVNLRATLDDLHTLVEPPSQRRRTSRRSSSCCARCKDAQPTVARARAR